MRLRQTSLRVNALSALIIVGSLGLGVGTSSANTRPVKPTVSPLQATQTVLGDTGGSVTLSSVVASATRCVFSSKPAISGLPVTVACSNGSVSKHVVIPSNPNFKVAKYKFLLSVIGAKTAKAKPVKVTVAASSAFAPSHVVALPSALNQVTVSWRPPTKTVAHTSYCLTIVQHPDTSICGVTSPETLDGLDPATITLTVEAATRSKNLGSSLPSAPVTVTGGVLVAPLVPTSVTAVADGGGNVTVSWTAPADNGAIISGYSVTSSADTHTSQPVNAPSTSLVYRGLTPGASVSFTVIAANSGFFEKFSPPSNPSNTVTVT